MKRLIILLLTMTLVLWAQDVSLTLKKPSGVLKMGDKPTFDSQLINNGNKPLEGIVLYLSLVNLDKGKEHPVDLEDWSAQKAVHINKLKSGKIYPEQWPMRLIQSGHYGLFVTAVLPDSNIPVTSKIIHFNVAPKKTVVPSRIWPVALGMPFFILLLMAFLWIRRKKNL